MGITPPLPNLPDLNPPQQHRLRTLTFLASAVILLAGVTADYSQGPRGDKPHVFTSVRVALLLLLLCRSTRVKCPALRGSHTTWLRVPVWETQLGAHVRGLLYSGTGGALGSPPPGPRADRQGGGGVKPGAQGR